MLKSWLNEKNKVCDINIYALPVIRYPSVIIGWPKEKIVAVNIKKRKLHTMQGDGAREAKE